MKIQQRLKAVKKALLIVIGLFLFIVNQQASVNAQTPVASFSAGTITGCAPLTVNFINQSTSADSYFWDFGNGNTSTLVNPTTVYIAPGSFTVTLIAINSLSGSRDTLVVSNYIFVPTTPIADFTASVLTGCTNSNNFTFTNLSIDGASYVWDFGDGNTSTLANPSHTYTTPGIYTVKLIAINSYGCTDVKTISAYLTVYQAPVANFTVNQQSSCNQNDVFAFTNTSTGATSWLWNFGDGLTSTNQNPSHTYSLQGAFTVSLIVTSANGCTDTVTHSAFINIGATLVPSFTLNSQTGCVPFTANFMSTVANATSWSWNFGDGTTSNMEDPSHIYNSPGNYNITLSVTTTSGCNGTVTMPNFIVVDPLPVAQFSVTNPTGCAPQQVNFANSSTGASSWLWNFGNGTTSTDQNPIVNYSTPGTFDVTLTVFSVNGCSATQTINQAVTINGITAAYSGIPRVGCAPLPVSFTGSSTPNAVSWSWNFGDGSTSTLQNPVHVYTATGNYSVTLAVTSAQGCIDTITRVPYIRVVDGFTPYTVPDTIVVCTPPGIVGFIDPTNGSNQWLWNFGDGDSSNQQNPVHTYTVPGIYIVTLSTSMAGGCSQFFNPFAIVNVLPFVTSPITSLIVSPCGPFTVQLDNSTLNVASYLWDFGDGTTSTLQNPIHTYSQQGTYQISLLLTAVNGCQTSLSTSVTFGHDNPIVISNNDACQDDVINFSLNPLSSFTSANWNFGDGTTSSQLEPSHAYSSTGTFQVDVTIIDTDGCQFSYTSATDVLISNPVAAFAADLPHEGCVPFAVHFNNLSVGTTSYSWDFGDGGTSTVLNPNHNYNVAGVYSVTLVATTNGCSRSITIPDLITANQAVAEFSFTPTTGCLPLTATFTDQSVNPVSWLWDFGDGATSTLQNPIHTFTIDPTSNVSLTIVDVNGCTRTKNHSNVNPVIPVVNVNDSIGCRPLLVNFSTTTNAQTYLWDFGDGTTSILKNPTHLYTQAGVYTVTLSCGLALGCTAITVKQDFIHVNAPVSEFMSPTVSVCAPSLVNFVNQSTGATSWLWNFGDGTSSSNENPAHIYNIPGTYTVSLISYTADGCPDTMVKPQYIVVPGTYSDFTLASNLNCLNTLAQFVDLSINATTWFWNFGDGFTSTLQNPSHLYADTGSYVVTLITTDNTGCSSFYSSANPIVIHEIPVANGVVDITSGCEPVTVSFSSNSSGSLNYTWNFGNGDSSNIQNPSYTYLTPGIYFPYLIAYNNYGCSDTFQIASPIHVNPVPVAAFMPSAIVGCTPFQVSFNNNSQQLSTATYQWDFGNGVQSTLENPVTVFNTAGVYTVTLVVSNIEGCTDTISITITVNQSPIAQGTLSDLSGCAPHLLNFASASQFASNLLWDFGDGNNSILDTTQHVYLTAGNYFPNLIAYSSIGCTDTLFFATPIVVHPIPQALFSVDQTAACPGTGFQFINQSQPSTGLNYFWTIGGTNYLTENPIVVLNSPGFYTAGLIVSNQFGCSDTLVKTDYLQVYDTLPPLVSPILSVSVINNTQVEIIWQNNAELDLGAYILYRRNNSTGVYDEVYRDNNPANSSLSVTSSYTDTGLNTLQNVYTYKLQTEDRCSYSLPFSSLIPHTTINITATAIANNIRVNWTPYIGCQVASYELNRTNLNTGQTMLVATLPPNTLTFFDPDFVCPHEYSYKVTATDLCGNTYTSLSDTSNAIPANILAQQQVEVVRSTVVNDQSVLTEWLPPVLAPQRVKEYRIMRSLDNVNFVQVAIVASNVFSYIDNNTEVQSSEYFYKVDVISDCEVAGAPSNNSSSILLKASHKDDLTRLWWTPYDKWVTGVDYYIIEQLNRIGQWERIKQVPGSVLETEIE
jgi:PKD repeat protein